jgi:hypothetical protein
MSEFDDIVFADDDGDHGELLAIAAELRRSRPIPSASARGNMRRAIASRTGDVRPRRFWRTVTGFACAGAACLAFALLGLAHRGPLDADRALSASADANLIVGAPRWSTLPVTLRPAALQLPGRSVGQPETPVSS